MIQENIIVLIAPVAVGIVSILCYTKEFFDKWRRKK